MTQAIVTQGTSEINQEYLSMAEAANELGVTTSALRRWVKNNPEFNDKYTQKQYHYCTISDKQRRMTVILKSSLLVMGNIKNYPTSNQHLKRNAEHTFSKTKQKIAETAITATLSQPMQEQLSMLMEYVKEQKSLEPPVSLTNGQREFLVERTRYYAIQTGITPSWVHSRLNKYVQRRSIDEYKFSDYKLAAKYLKEMYQASHLNWE